MTGRARSALAGLVAAGAAEAWLAHRSAATGGVLVHRWALLALIGGMLLAYAVALACVRAVPVRVAVVAVLVFAAVLRLASVAHKAPLSDDLYRYAWDGAVQSAGTDPYRYPPDAPELRPLRDPWLWPARLVGKHRDTLLNRENVPTIYPPVAQAWFWLEHQVVPRSARDEGYELAAGVLDLGVLAALLALLRRAGRDPRWAAVYGLAPLAVLEGTQNAHVDVLAVLLVLGAVAAGRRTALASAGLAAAALVKVYPGLLLVLLLGRRGLRAKAVAVGVAAGLAALTYLPHVLAVGPEVVGYLPGYLQEERYGEGTRYLLLGLLGLQGRLATAAVAFGVLAVAGLLVRARVELAQGGVRLLAAVLLLVTPVQPWYALLLLALVALTGDWWALPLTVAAYPLFFATVLDGPAVAAGRWSYGIAGLLAAGGLLVRHWRGEPRQGTAVPAPTSG